MSQYNIDQNKKNAEYTPYSATADLTKYGIDYSPEQRDAIAQIFKNSANTAYGKALNNYSNEMANQQKSLQDTIRRSQAQAVATGASRGLQAANELSNILGLQEQAAQGATELQGIYADALANAEKSAMELQNQRAQIGAQMVSSADAAAAQGYSVNMDYQANDPFRVFEEAAALRAEGRTAEADYLIQVYGASSGVDPEIVDKAINNINHPVGGGDDKNDGILKPEGSAGPATWSAGSNGVLSLDGIGNLRTGDKLVDKEWFNIDFDGDNYRLALSGVKVTQANNADLYNTLSQLAGNKAADKTFVYYNGAAYVGIDGSWHKIADDKREGNKFYKHLKGSGSQTT